jgi:hypothetical protein
MNKRNNDVKQCLNNVYEKEKENENQNTHSDKKDRLRQSKI